MPKYVPAEAGLWEFTCPYCETLCSQAWRDVLLKGIGDRDPEPVDDVRRCVCRACDQVSWWVDGGLTYPRRSPAPPASDGMPSDVRALYDEACAIADLSPRSASALLRTAVEVLCHNHLDQADTKLNDAIGNLVATGRLDEELQQAMDLLRITGNGAVHPREIRLDDDGPQNVEALFELLNLIVERLVARPQRIKHLYAQIPQEKRDAVERRDGQGNGPIEA